MDGVNLKLPLQFECESTIPTPAAQVLWKRWGCSGSMDGENLMLPLQSECEPMIPTPTAQVVWER